MVWTKSYGSRVRLGSSETRVLNDRTDFVPLAFRPEESALLVGAGQHTPRPTLELWRLADGAPLRTLTVAFGGSRLASPRGDRVVVWRETEAVVRYLKARGFTLTHRRIGALSEIQRRVSGVARRQLLRLNDAAYRWNWPAHLATTQLLVFEKK